MNKSLQSTPEGSIGILGLGLLSRNLILTIARQGFPVICHDADPLRSSELRERAGGLPIRLCDAIDEFAKQLSPPRAILMLMPGGPHLEGLFHELGTHLAPGDFIIDGASTHHIFTPRRRKFFADHGIHYLATGIAAPCHGNDPCYCALFPELEKLCGRIAPIFDAVARTATGEPCVTFVGEQVGKHLRRLRQREQEQGVPKNGESLGSVSKGAP